MLKLFVSSLKMMELRGYHTEQFQNIVDIYDTICDLRMKNKPLTDNLKNIQFLEIVTEIHSITQNFFRIPFNINEFIKSERGYMSYIVMNYTTGMRTVVNFTSTEKLSLSAPDFSVCLDLKERVSMELNINNQNVKNDRVGAVFIIRGKLNSIPNERNKVILNTEFINEELVLCNPYNNVFQSQNHIMEQKEEEEFYSHPSISKKLIPSIKLDTDTYYQYLDVKEGNVVKSNREEFDEQALRTTLFYRLAK